MLAPHVPRKRRDQITRRNLQPGAIAHDAAAIAPLHVSLKSFTGPSLAM